MTADVLGIGWVTVGGLGRGREDGRFALQPGALPIPARKDVFAEPDLRFGRLDPFSRVGLAAIALALQDAGFDRWQEKRPYALIADSRYGCLATDSDYFDTVLPQDGRLASPNLFAYTLPNCFLGEAAIRFGLTGPAAVTSSGDASGLAPLRLALETLAWGEAAVAVAGICDLPRPPLLGEDAADRPGAVFLVLAVPGSHQGAPEIVLDSQGTLLIEGKPMTDLEETVQRLRG
jgi:3-oxoacyl-[acyl-carrier-protein] synthase II